MNDSASHQYVGLTSLAERLGLPPAWLKAEAEAGRIPHLKVGTRLKFDVLLAEQALSALACESGRAGVVD